MATAEAPAASHRGHRILGWIPAGVVLVALVIILWNKGQQLIDGEASGFASYLIVVALIIGDAIFPVLPGETTLNAACVLATTGTLSFGLVVLSGVVGATVGDSTLYWLARSAHGRIHDWLGQAVDGNAGQRILTLLRDHGNILSVGRLSDHRDRPVDVRWHRADRFVRLGSVTPTEARDSQRDHPDSVRSGSRAPPSVRLLTRSGACVVSSDEPTAADLAAIQAELRALRERNQESESEGDRSPRRSVGSMARSTAVVVLLVLATLCVTLAPVTIWGRNLVLNTDRYVSTLSPVAANPGVQDLVIKQVDNQVDSHIDVKTLVAQALPPRAVILAAPLQSAVAGLINTVTTRFVRSPAFQKLWVTVNRTAHAQLVYLLTGKHPAGAAVVLSKTGQVTLQLAPIVEQVKSRLVAAGLTVAKNIPAAGATIVIAQAKGLAQARRAVRALDTIADVLPWLALVLFAGAIATARRRRRALIVSAFCTAGGMAFLGLALLVVRHLYLDRIDPTRVPHDTAKFLFDTVVRFLRDGIRIVLAVALVVVLVAWVTGASGRARRLRHGIGSTVSRATAAAASGPLAQLAREHTQGCRIGIIAAALFVLVLFTGISLLSVIVVAVIAGLLLLAVEWLRVSTARAPRAPA